MYALRHGVTGRIWEIAPGGLWLFKSPKSMEKAWKTAKKAGLVSSEFGQHKVIVIKLLENDSISPEKACIVE